METPEQIKSLAPQWRTNSWKEYSIGELASWYSLLMKRSGHRKDEQKANKDRVDAVNYFLMLESAVKSTRAKLELEGLL